LTEPDILRFAAIGSAGDGKSTSIGRLLHDCGGVHDDQLESVRAAQPGALDLALISDGLQVERVQGLTIDVAYRYFGTSKRKFLIADLGHEPGTRNLVAAASTADLSLILIDARKGVLPQTKRHASISWLLGIRRFAVVVNKMDLVEYRRQEFDVIRQDFGRFAQRLSGCELEFFPVSVLAGDNVARRSERMPWFDGETLLSYLENVAIGRGDMLADPGQQPFRARHLRVTLVWMAQAPMRLNHPYLVEHAGQRVCAAVCRLVSRLDVETLEERDAATLCLDEIGSVELETHRPLIADPYSQNRTTGSLILIDPASNQTVAAGMIASAEERPAPSPSALRGLTVWVTGLSASGKSTLSRAVYERLLAMGHKAELLDGDALRQHLCKDLGFSKRDRDENIRRIGFVAELLTRNGAVAVAAAISPYREIRDEIRQKIGNFVEVYTNAPLAVCEERDIKGLYKKARAGQIAAFTGISDPYEPPLRPEVECNTDRENLAESVEKVMRALQNRLPA